MHKWLAAGLAGGGFFVGAVLLWLMDLYVGEGLLSTAVAIAGFLAGFAVLVLPQWVLAFYLWRTKPE